MPNPKGKEFIPTRASLLERLRSWDDQESWKAFFDIYWPMLYSVAVRAGLTDAEAQDVVQETVISVARKLPDFRYDPQLGSFKSWLMLITRRKIIDHLRRKGRDPAKPHSPADPASTRRTGTAERIPDPHADPLRSIWAEEWEANVFRAALKKTKSEVDPRQFQIFDCYALKGWSPEQVAQSFKISLSSVYATKSRISALIREEIGRLEKRMI